MRESGMEDHLDLPIRHGGVHKDLPKVPQEILA